MTPRPDGGPGAAWFAALPAPARAHQGRPAGLVSRTLAAVVDCVVLGVVLAGLYLGWAVVEYSLDPVRFTFPAPARLVTFAVAAGIAVLYLAVCWTATGRSVGDQLLALRVVDHRGRPPRPVRALARALGCVFVPVGLLWVVAGGRRRSLQDLLLRTSVVYDWNPRLRPVSPGTSDAGDSAA
ncbi:MULTISPECIES: RDD family protein [Amycolatopsis]|uniref:RDD domain-containing protein n=1 Tax=Amycolatopsis tucumanensis TaxID=401106 RepID=A0ABP7HR52_9PSEU|nr:MULTISPECIES: RDD family protein [Amycolatopsis]MCF6420683.1 RDD family protein [Amycolatopsis tucumanensis]